MKKKSIDNFIIVELFDQQNNFILSDNKFKINTKDNVFLQQTLKKIKQYKNSLWILCPIFGYTDERFIVKIENLVPIRDNIKDMQTSYYGTLKQVLSTKKEIYKNKTIKGVACISVNSILKKLRKLSLKGGGKNPRSPENSESENSERDKKQKYTTDEIDDVLMTPEEGDDSDTPMTPGKIGGISDTPMTPNTPKKIENREFTEEETKDLMNDIKFKAMALVLRKINVGLADQLMIRGINRQYKELVDNSIVNITFTFPRTFSGNIVKTIQNLCKSFGKKPSECKMVVNCDCSIEKEEVTYTPKIIKEIIKSGVIIVAKIIFQDSEKTGYITEQEKQKYVSNLERILEPFVEVKLLDLNFYRLSDVTRNVLMEKLVEMLTRMDQLTSLSLSTVELSVDQLKRSLSYMPNLSSFSINKLTIVPNKWIFGMPEPPKLTDQYIAENLTVLETLSKLKILNCPQILKALKSLDLSNLTSLDFSDYLYQDSLISEIYNALVTDSVTTKVPNLISLNLSNNSIPPSGELEETNINTLIKLFSTLNNLEELNISKNGMSESTMENMMKQIEDGGILRSLKFLNVSHNKLTLENIKELIRILPSLRSLNVSNNLKLETEIELKEYLKGFPSLVVVLTDSFE